MRRWKGSQAFKSGEKRQHANPCTRHRGPEHVKSGLRKQVAIREREKDPFRGALGDEAQLYYMDRDAGSISAKLSTTNE